MCSCAGSPDPTEGCSVTSRSSATGPATVSRVPPTGSGHRITRASSRASSCRRRRGSRRDSERPVDRGAVGCLLVRGRAAKLLSEADLRVQVPRRAPLREVLPDDERQSPCEVPHLRQAGRAADLGWGGARLQGQRLLRHRLQARGRKTEGRGGEGRDQAHGRREACRRCQEENRLRRQVTPHEVIPAALVNAALSLDASLSRPDLVFTFGETRDPAHGDYATNLALTLAPKLGKKPRAVAEAIVARLELPPGYVSKIEVAGPGFINFFLAREERAAVLARILADGPRDGRGSAGTGRAAGRGGSGGTEPRVGRCAGKPLGQRPAAHRARGRRSVPSRTWTCASSGSGSTWCSPNRSCTARGRSTRPSPSWRATASRSSGTGRCGCAARRSATTRTGCSGSPTGPTPISFPTSRITATSASAGSRARSTCGARTTTATCPGCAPRCGRWGTATTSSTCRSSSSCG